MGRSAKLYVHSVIGAGGAILIWALLQWSQPDLTPWAIFTLLAIVASMIKLRLPGMEGTYSLSALFLLYGVSHFSLPETLIAAAAGAVAQSYFRAQKRPVPIQVLFNTANLIITVACCFAVSRTWLQAGTAHNVPAVTALVACVYFLVNTVLVSGVLSLLQNKALSAVCSEWYVWSFPYYLVGVAVVALLPSPGYSVSAEAWLIVLPAVYLVHFFLGLVEWHATAASAQQVNDTLSGAVRWYVSVIVAACVIVLGFALYTWLPDNPRQFVMYLLLSALAATLKVRLPRMKGTITPAFVLVLAAIAQMTLAETLILALVGGSIQVMWRPARTPRVSQLLFNPACLVLGSALAWFLCRIELAQFLGNSVAGMVVIASLVMYASNTIMVAVVLALSSHKPLSGVWRLCYFWSLPYYLVGTAAAGIMIAVSRTAQWPASLLVLPMVGLVYLSYRVQLSRAAARSSQVMA